MFLAVCIIAGIVRVIERLNIFSCSNIEDAVIHSIGPVASFLFFFLAQSSRITEMLHQFLGIERVVSGGPKTNLAFGHPSEAQLAHASSDVAPV